MDLLVQRHASYYTRPYQRGEDGVGWVQNFHQWMGSLPYMLPAVPAGMPVDSIQLVRDPIDRYVSIVPLKVPLLW